MIRKPNILISGNSDCLYLRYLANQVRSADSFNMLSLDTEAGIPQEALLRNVIVTPAANYLVARGINSGTDHYDNMPAFVDAVESEIDDIIMPDGNRRIDIVWYYAGNNVDSTPEKEAFVRSVAGMYNALLIVSPDFSDPAEFCEDTVFLSGLAGDRIVLDYASIPGGGEASGTVRLLEKTKDIYLNSRALTEEEEEQFDSAWESAYSEKVYNFYDMKDEECFYVIDDAAVQAQKLVSGQDDLSLGKDIGNLTQLIVEMIRAAKNKTPVADANARTRSDWTRRDRAFAAELKANIVFMIHKVEACYGRVIPPRTIKEYLSVIPDTFPNDAAAVTYAIGTAAKTALEFPNGDMDDFREFFMDAKEEAMEMTFDQPGCLLYGDAEKESDADDDNDEHITAPVSIGETHEKLDMEAFFEEVKENTRHCRAEEDTAFGDSDTVSADRVAGKAGVPALIAPAEEKAAKSERKSKKSAARRPKKSAKTKPNAEKESVKPAKATRSKKN